jgi:hypothetical protein
MRPGERSSSFTDLDGAIRAMQRLEIRQPVADTVEPSCALGVRDEGGIGAAARSSPRASPRLRSLHRTRPQLFRLFTPVDTDAGITYGPFGLGLSYLRGFDGTRVTADVQINFLFDPTLGFDETERVLYRAIIEANVERIWNKFAVTDTAKNRAFPVVIGLTTTGPAFDQFVAVRARWSSPRVAPSWHVGANRPGCMRGRAGSASARAAARRGRATAAPLMAAVVSPWPPLRGEGQSDRGIRGSWATSSVASPIIG